MLLYIEFILYLSSLKRSSPRSRSHNGWQLALESGGSPPPPWSWAALETLGSQRSRRHSQSLNREDTAWQSLFHDRFWRFECQILFV